MGERKGTNKYYPPDYDPAKGGLNAYHGTHALRERARKLHEGILIIRFEMPYNIWCNGCGKHIGMGVRYNAQKRKMGYYYTTPIYKFRMKCHLCDQHFEIQTDPKNCDYQIMSGCRRKEERWDTEKAGNVQTLDREVKDKLMTNAMYKLEHEASDQKKARKVAPTLTRLEEIRDSWKDDFAVNQILRKKFREEKKEIMFQQASDDDVKNRANLPEELNLLQENDEDKKTAKRMRFGEDVNTPAMVRKLQRRKIKEDSIFGTNDGKTALVRALTRRPSASPIGGERKDTLFSSDSTTFDKSFVKLKTDKAYKVHRPHNTRADIVLSHVNESWHDKKCPQIMDDHSIVTSSSCCSIGEKNTWDELSREHCIATRPESVSENSIDRKQNESTIKSLSALVGYLSSSNSESDDT